jgi:hypothetical protein
MPAPTTRARARPRPTTAPHRRYCAALVGAAATALLAAACGGSGAPTVPTAHASSAASTAAPNCLPASYDRSAALPGLSVDVSPTPGSDTADPATQISFLGVPAAQVASVAVVGSRSGTHAGNLEAYSQGDGASFVPSTPFVPGEQVTVHATVGGKPASFSFGIDEPYSTTSSRQFPNRVAPSTDYQTFATLPGAQAPVLTVTTADHDPGAGDIFTTDGPGPGRYGAEIYAPSGRLVWYDQLPSGLVAEDLNVQTYDGQRDLTLWQGRVLQLGFGQGEDLVLNSQYQTVATVRGGNGLQADLHEFQIGPNNVAYVTAYNPIHCDMKSIGGSANGVLIDVAIEEIDLKTGLVRWEWHALDHVPPTQSEYSVPTTSGPWDWFHLNSIDPQPNGDVLISARNTWTIYQLAGGSGQILWQLGGLKSSFAAPSANSCAPPTKDSACGAWQHDARMLPDGELTFFDDGSDPPVEPQSRALRVSIDLSDHTAHVVADYTHPGPPLLTASQGDMETLGGGYVVVDYGGVPEVAEYSTGGRLLFDAHLPYDMASYRGYRYAWSATPAAPPAVVATLNNTAEETIVHASWNGATGVASWRILAGASATSLSAQTTVPASGFETSTLLPTSFISSKTKTNGFVEVQALDSQGHLLGSSHVVGVESYSDSDPVG